MTLPITISPSAILLSAVCTRTVRSSATGSRNFFGLALEGNKIFILKLHPQMIGRASRIGMVGEFIAYMQNHGAWITTCEDVARYVQKQNGGNRA